MSIKQRLIILNFLEFFVFGSWLISFGGYLINTLHFSGLETGSIYATMGIASVFMPALLGIVADKWLNVERVLGICHIAGAALLLAVTTLTTFKSVYVVMLLYSMTYMPTIALSNTVSYIALERFGFNIVKSFPPIRTWGTIGFIVAMWITDLLHLTYKPTQLYVSAAAALVLGIYAFTVVKCPPLKSKEKKSLTAALGLDAFVLFKNTKMLIFFIFAMFLGAALQITNTFGGSFLRDFTATYGDSFAVTHPNILLSISQISETLFILTIPFFLIRFGIKRVMLMSMLAWVLRFALFGIGNPGPGFPYLILSMIVYGMAFDFFNISGSMFVEKEADVKMRASAQGLFMLMTNGLGAFLGGTMSGWVVDHYTIDGVKHWPSIWFAFAGYALVLAVAFQLIFRYKHDPTMMVGEVKH